MKLNRGILENVNNITDFQMLEFDLIEDTRLLLTCCIRDAKRNEIKKLENIKITLLSGMVKSVNIDVELNKDYAEICNSVGIKNLNLLIIYIPTEDGNISVKAIKGRLSNILNEEFREVGSVKFITPMVVRHVAN